jgi:hypothetical protein
MARCTSHATDRVVVKTFMQTSALRPGPALPGDARHHVTVRLRHPTRRERSGRPSVARRALAVSTHRPAGDPVDVGDADEPHPNWRHGMYIGGGALLVIIIVLLLILLLRR